MMPPPVIEAEAEAEAAPFRTACTRAGYDEKQTDQLSAAARRLSLPADVATRWMDGGFTPWAAVVWLEHEFHTPAEASGYRGRGVDAEAAFWMRFDHRHDEQ